MQIKNKPQTVDILGQPLPERISAAIRDTRAPTSPFDSSSALSSGLSSAPAVGVSGFQFFDALNKPAVGAFNDPSFGAQSAPAFGASISPSFGAHSTVTFGASNSPSFGAQSTPAFGSSTSLLFGAQSTPALGAHSTPAFGASSTPSFGVHSTPAFVALNSPSFGAPGTPAASSHFGCSSFASTPVSSLFGPSRTPAADIPSSHFGAPNTPASGTSNSPIFGVSTTPAWVYPPPSNGFYAPSTPFDVSSAPTFGGSRTTGSIKITHPDQYPDQYGGPTNSVFGRSFPASNDSYSTFGPPTVTTPTGFFHSPFDRTIPGGVISAKSGTQCSFPNGSSSQLPGDGFNTQGPCVCAFNSGYQQARANYPAQYYDKDGQIPQSISAMQAQKGIDMSHEELRWIDYRQHRDKGNRVSNSAWIKGTNTNSTPDCENVQPLPNMSNTTKSNMISISINIEAPSGVVTQLLDLLKSFHINVESSSTSPPTTAPASSTSFCTAPF